MIDRFNFYDLYGYFLPGIALIGTLWLPFGVVLARWPSSEIASLSALVIVSYIVGYFIQSMATYAVPSGFGKLGYPSSFLLDAGPSPGRTQFSAKIKERIGTMTIGWFGLDVFAADKAECAKNRQDAFMLARLVGNNQGKYGEQFQGLYSMMRGMFVAFSLGFLYTLGWILSSTSTQWIVTAAFWVFGVAFLVALGASLAHLLRAKYRVQENIVSLVAIALMAFLAGYLIGAGTFERLVGVIKITPTQDLMLAATALLYLLAAVRFYGAYDAFAIEFARAVWQQFAANPLERPKS